MLTSLSPFYLDQGFMQHAEISCHRFVTEVILGFVRLRTLQAITVLSVALIPSLSRSLTFSSHPSQMSCGRTIATRLYPTLITLLGSYGQGGDFSRDTQNMAASMDQVFLAAEKMVTRLSHFPICVPPSQALPRSVP